MYNRPLTGHPNTGWDVERQSRRSGPFQSCTGLGAGFGRLIGYTAVVLPGYGSDFGGKYDVDGNLVGSIRQLERLGEAVLVIKHGDTRLTGILARRSQ